MQYVDAFIGGDRAEELKRRYAAGDNIGDGHIKQELGEAINTLIQPMRERREKLEGPGGDARVLEVISQGIKRANVVAEETLHLSKKAMKLDFGGRRLSQD
jgi:tryptophanyl-tRNA synthetase